MSEAFKRFKSSFFVEPSREGIDLDVLNDLNPEERVAAETLLLDHLSEDADREVMALGYLKSTKAVDPIKRILRASRGRMRALAAQAIWRITKDAECVSVLCKLAEPGLLRSREARLAAVMALGEVDGVLAMRALRLCLDDRDFLIAEHALNFLAFRLGLMDTIVPPAGNIEPKSRLRERVDLREKVVQLLDAKGIG